MGSPNNALADGSTTVTISGGGHTFDLSEDAGWDIDFSRYVLDGPGENHIVLIKAVLWDEARKVRSQEQASRPA